MKLLKDAQIKDRTILLRVDFNVTVEDGRVTEDFRMRATLPTIRYLLTQGAKKVLVLSHFGRPEGKANHAFSLAPVGRYLSSLLGEEVDFGDDCVGEKIRSYTQESKKRVVLLENLRFHKEEEENDSDFAKNLASLGDMFVQEAFGASHREHASIVGVPRFLPSYAGFLFEKEVSALSSVLKNPARPLTALIGGAKISTKMPVIEKFLKFADNVCLGGALANTALRARGIAVGKSLIEEGMIEKIKNFQITDTRLHVPIDVIVARDKDAGGDTSIEGVGSVEDDELILDIGPDTQDLFSNIIHHSKMIVWNGPMGYLENEKFAEGTRRVAKELGSMSGKAFTIVGGGDTYLTLQKVGVMDKINFISTGGGAMLDFLAKGTLPGIEALH